MTSSTLKIVAIITVIAIVISGFSVYMILDSIRVQEQLNELQDAVEQLSIQEGQLAAQEEQLNELQDAVEQLSIQEGQLGNLLSALDETKISVKETKSSLLTLTSQMNTLNQSTSRDLAELRSAVETLEGLVSNLSNLQGFVDQLLNLTPAEVYEATYKSIVVIRTPLGQGSGFFFNNSTIIATNYHVVEDETDIEIEFFDRKRTQATVIGSDAYSDIAVLIVDTAPAEVKALSFSDQIFIGQQVVAIGNPLGLTESLSVGYISQVNKLLDIDPIIIPVLQLDLTIAPGSSGSPLLDLYGNVVGITNAGTDEGFNFAVPGNIITRVVPSLISEGEYRHPFVGIGVLALTPEVINSENISNVDPYQTGLLITDVISGSPADDAGLDPAIFNPGTMTAVDIILAIDGYPTFTAEDWSAYMEVEVSPGQSVTLTLWRSGVLASADVTPTKCPPYEG
jgi:serine protease Do